MKKVMLILLVVLAAAAVAMAAIPQDTGETTDILGAHLGYGRGCVMCHAPHSGPAGNNKAVNDAQAGEYALWGQDLTPLYGQSLTFSGDGPPPTRSPSRLRARSPAPMTPTPSSSSA